MLEPLLTIGNSLSYFQGASGNAVDHRLEKPSVLRALEGNPQPTSTGTCVKGSIIPDDRPRKLPA